MLIKFMKHGPVDADRPTYTESIFIKQVSACYVHYEPGLKALIQCGEGGSETISVSVGKKGCNYNVAYIMNDSGVILETIT